MMVLAVDHSMFNRPCYVLNLLGMNLNCIDQRELFKRPEDIPAQV